MLLGILCQHMEFPAAHVAHRTNNTSGSNIQPEHQTEMKFYCVGYTPMRHYMNGYQIGNLEGHKVRNMAVDLIATFLPDDVVDAISLTWPARIFSTSPALIF